MLLLAPIALAATSAELRAGLASQAGWEEVTRKQIDEVGEILIRHKVIAGEDCLEGSTAAALPPDVLLGIAADIDNQPKWSSWDVPTSRKLTTGDSFDYFQVLDNPNPIADRYWFLTGASRRVGEERVFTWELVDPAVKWPTQLAEVKERYPNAVMTTVNVGDWTFTPDGATTRIRYRICTDAGGNIPRWVGELAATRTLPTNVADLVKEGRRRVKQ